MPGGHAGEGREALAADRARPKPALPAERRLGRHRGREPRADGVRPSGPAAARRPWPFLPIIGIPVPGPLDNTLERWSGVSGQWRRSRTFDRQITNLMLYPTELSVEQTTGIEPATSGLLRRSATELGPQPISTTAPYAALAAPPARAEARSSNRCAHRGTCDRERAYTGCDRLPQAAISWRERGNVRRGRKATAAARC